MPPNVTPISQNWYNGSVKKMKDYIDAWSLEQYGSLSANHIVMGDLLLVVHWSDARPILALNNIGGFVVGWSLERYMSNPL